LFVGEYEGLGAAPPNGSEFQQGLINACRLVTDRHVLFLVLIDKKTCDVARPAWDQRPDWGPVGTDIVGGGQLLPLPLLELT